MVLEFYHTMTSRGVANPTSIHFSVDNRLMIPRATDIVATHGLPVVLTNSTGYRQWPHPSPWEMVRFLSRDTSAGSILFRRQHPQRMLLIDHILRCNLFPLQHHVQRRGVILEAMYQISEGFWFSPAQLIMTSLFHFKNKVHHRSLPRAESIPLLFPRLLYQVLEHIGFPEESRIECRQVCDVVKTLDRARSVPQYFHLKPLTDVEDDLAEDLLAVEQPSYSIPTKGAPPPIPDSPSLVLIPATPRLTDPITSTAPLPPQHIPVSP